MLAASTANNATGYILAFITAAFASANMVGGYAVTDRMLQMFRTRAKLDQPKVSASDHSDLDLSKRDSPQLDERVPELDKTGEGTAP
jgi:NAD(P) transhydrogenase subunit alpha